MKTFLLSNNLNKLMLIPCFIFGLSTLAQTNETEGIEFSITKTIHDPDIVWNPAPDFFPGCSFTILHGDLAKPNLDFFFKIEPNTEIINHTHNSAERMILISGELEVQYEGEKPQILKAGTYAYGPANKPHRAKCLNSGQCVLFVAMIDPFDAVPIDKK
ncbi:cupin domain-containing protein [Geojedonia litorea]|uniref:Cupin domain-containing protein n=1 Tax=Geojedonia litorea TaxID=1268269 RepID=A0ABV9N3M8_9FLAO